MSTSTPDQLDDLIAELREEFGEAAVDSSEAARFAYGRDLWPKLTLQVRDRRGPLPKPQVVLRPSSEDQVVAMVLRCGRHGVPIVPFGSGSGVCGGAAPIEGGVVIDLKGLCQLFEVDSDNLQLTCGPGIITQDLEQRLNDLGFTLGHFPSSIFCASIGGCVAARGAGQLSSHYGKIEDMVTGLKVATPGMGLIATGSLDPSGHSPDWTPMFVGSEGTLGLFTALQLRIRPLPQSIALRGLRFPDLDSAMECFRQVLQSGLRPSAMRIYDPLDTWMAMSRSNDDGGSTPRPGGGTPMEAPSDRPTSEEHHASPENWLESLGPLSILAQQRGGLGLRARVKGLLRPEALPIHRMLGKPLRVNQLLDLLPKRCLAIVGCEGEEQLAREELNAVISLARSLGAEDLGPEPGERWFRTRHHVSFKLPKLLTKGAFADTMEVAAPWSKVRQLYDGVREAVREHVLVMAHLSHAYHEGCSIYFTFVGHSNDPQAAEHIYQQTWQAALEATIRCGGTITHHHGVGVLKMRFMEREHGNAAALYAAARHSVDPDLILNPGKLFPHPTQQQGPTNSDLDPLLLATGKPQDGVVEVGGDWNGADLVAQLHGQGALLPPLGREFLEQKVSDWLASRAVAAHHAIHGAWEHPLVAASGRLKEGQHFRSGLLPRSAAGPSWLPLALGPKALPTEPQSATFRVYRGLRLSYIGCSFDNLGSACTALSSALRGSVRPLAGTLFTAERASDFAAPSRSSCTTGTRAFIHLVLSNDRSHPDQSKNIGQALEHLGGRMFAEEQVMRWWQQHWGRACKEGAASLEETTICGSGEPVGRCAATIPWTRAALLIQAVETLCGGPHSAIGWIDNPLESGCTVRFLISASRRSARGTHLLEHQIAASLRSYGARLINLEIDHSEELPDYLVSGRGAGSSRPSDSQRLAQEISNQLLTAKTGDLR